MTNNINYSRKTMTLPGRRLKKYHPRRSRKTVKEQKQQLLDLERKISSDVGKLLLLIENRQAEQVHETSLKVRSDLLKYGSEMSELAGHMHGVFPKAVQDFLSTLDQMTKSAPGWIEEDKVRRCYEVREKLYKLAKIGK